MNETSSRFKEKSMKRPLRCGLIGVRGFGKVHLRILKEFQKNGLVELVSYADPFVERTSNLAKELKSAGVRGYDDFQEMLETEKKLEAVSIATPIPLHEKMTRAALERNLYVYLEKPPFPSIQQLDQLVSLDTSKKVVVAFQQISMPHLQRIKEWIVSGKLGKIKSIKGIASWPRLTQYYERSSWSGKLSINDELIFDGPASNALAHIIHNIMFLAGTSQDAFNQPSHIKAELYRARPIESYDLICMKGDFDTGTHFFFTASHATKNRIGYRIEVCGTKGKAWISEEGECMGNDLGLENIQFESEKVWELGYRNFVEYASGKCPRAFTHLNDTRGYLIAVNGSFVSSSGIHTIEPNHKRLYKNKGDTGYHILDSEVSLQKAFQSESLFSDLKLPWASFPKSIPLQKFNYFMFDQPVTAA